MYVCVLLSTQLCLTLCDPIDCSPPGSSGHGILQARILEWVAMPSSGGSSRPKGSNSGLPDYRWILYHLSHQRKQGPRAGREWRRNPWPFLPPPVGKTKSQPVRVPTMAPSSRVSSWGLRRCGGNPAGQCWNSSCLVLERLWGDTPWPSAEKSQQDSRRGKIVFRLKPHTYQRHSEVSNKPCAHQETPQRLSQNCVSVSPVEVQVSSGLPQGQGLSVH